VFFFYYVWSFFSAFIYYFRNILEFFFIKINHTNIFYKNNFNYLNYFEKLFLSLFHKENLFYNFYNDSYNNLKIFNYRFKNYPMILFFHFFNKKETYSYYSLNALYKQFKYIKKIKNNSFIDFLIIQKFFFKKYFNLYSSFFYKSYSEFNNLKLIFFFFNLYSLSKNKFIVYNLNVFNDWYKYNFNLNFVKNISVKKINLNLFYLKDKFFKYNKLFLKNFKQSYKNIYFFKLFAKDLKMKINSDWKKLLNKHYFVKFSESSLSKYININSVKLYKFNFIRKNRIFNKSRYSRNRQLYRTGVYWCLWLNVLVVYGLFFVFYRFTFNFGYFWWGILILFYSTIFSRILKYNFYNVFFLIGEFKNLIFWYGYIFKNIINYFVFLINKYLLIDNTYLYFNSFSNFVIFLKLYFYKFYFKTLKNMELKKFTFFWEGMKEKDESFLRYKTVIHWFKQAYKVLIS